MSYSVFKQREGKPYFHLFALLKPSMDWMLCPHIGEGNVLTCLQIQVLTLETPSQAHPEIKAQPAIWTSHDPSIP